MAVFENQEIRMRILQINAVYGVMSTGRLCKELHDWVVARGHEVLTVYGSEPKAEVPETEAIYLGSSLEHKVHALIGRLVGDVGVGSWRATRCLLDIIQRYRPDVVHLHNLHGNFVHIPMLLRFLAKEDIPTVVHNHDCFWFTGGCMHYTSNNCYKWQTDCIGCQYLKRGKEFLFKNEAHRNLAQKTRLFQAIPRLAVCGVSEWTERQARMSPVFQNAKLISYVYNWIDLEVFTPQGYDADQVTRERYGIKNRQMILGVASGWGHGKGLEDFIVLSRRISDKQVIVLVGRIPKDTVLPSNIIHIEATDSMFELAKLYSAADIFVHLSKEETFGKVIAEALACGTPAVVYNSTAMPEIIDAVTGRVVEPGDIDRVLSNINELLSIDYENNCRQRAEQMFAKDTNCQCQLKIYHSIIT